MVVRMVKDKSKLTPNKRMNRRGQIGELWLWILVPLVILSVLVSLMSYFDTWTHDNGEVWIKTNTDPTIVSAAGARYVITGTSNSSIDNKNFIHVQDGNALQYTGRGGKFHIIGTVSLTSGVNNVLGVYIAINRNPGTPLNPDADRISESEVYMTSSGTRPEPATVQTLEELRPGDRVYLIVQNRNNNVDITVEFMKLISTGLTRPD